MKGFKLIALLVWMIGGAWQSFAQTPIIKTKDYPVGYFRSPLNIPAQASGTFGELRSTHFHAGDDYRTQQKTGLPLFAVAEGFISRVRVQNSGGGLSVYIDHPNGYTSVYLHMLSYAPALEKIVRAEQYRRKSYEVDLTLDPQQMPVKKGDQIGLAGNSGSSQGPHLHFEIRETKTQHPINTQLFGLTFPDKVKPIIQGITLFDLGNQPFSEHTPRRHFTVKNQQNGQYQLSQTAPLLVNGPFGVGIQTIDRHDGTSFNNGVYSIQLQLDGQDISIVLFEKLDFETSSAIHSYIDYPSFILRNVKIQKSFKAPNHPSGVYHYLDQEGILHLQDQKVHTLTYIVRDVHGNTSQISFKVQNSDTYQPKKPSFSGLQWMDYNKENRYENDYIKVVIPKDALYDRLYFNYSQGPQPARAYSPVHHIHNRMTPLFKAYELWIKADSLPAHLRDKAILVNDRGGSIGGTYKEGYIYTQTKQFGSFHIKVDTVPPKIQSLQLSEGKNLAGVSRISFKISDDLSGIQSINAFIDEEWILMQYDPKTATIWHVFETGLSKGKHSFRLEVSDAKQNKQTYIATFNR
jgi:hypothetical protein